MREIKLAASAGFCHGVARSVNMTGELLDKGPCYALGEVIHNADVMRKFKERGLTVIDSAEELPEGARVIIRAHGASEAQYTQLSERGAVITDATCPNVSRIHRIVRDASDKGRQVLVIGAAEHPEIRGICGWCEGALVFADAAELESWLLSNETNRTQALSVVAQTTLTSDNLENCKKLLKKLCTNPEVFDTICFATSERQEEAMRLSAECDSMVVIGGRNSANSLRLARLCGERCENTQFIERASELDAALLRKGETIGVTAGASAPAWIIKEVLETMSDEIFVNENQTETPVEHAEEAIPAAESEEAAVGEEAPVCECESAPEEEAAASECVITAPEPEAEPAAEEPAAEEPAPQEAPKAEMSFDEMLEDSLKPIYNGDRVSGIVVAITQTEVSVDLGTKYSAFIPVEELMEEGVKLEDSIKLGDTIEAIVVRVNDVEGTAQLSKKRLDAVKGWADVEAACENGTIVEGVVTEENKGGIVVNVKGVRVFVPASQSGLPKEAAMTELVKQKVRLKITEVNRGRRRVVGSIRAIAQRERRERAEAVWNEIEVGKSYSGVVKSLTSYGAFVDIGGVDGMVHVSELSWNRIRQPSDVVAVGDPLEVHVISFDRDAHRISLGCRKAADNPWAKFTDAYAVGDVVSVKIVKLMPFGAFAEVLPGVDGLIHISQIANRRIGQPSEILTVGEVTDAKITNIDHDKQKISLSIRALSEPEPARKEEKDEEPAQPEDDALVYEVSESGEATGNAPEPSETPELPETPEPSETSEPPASE